MPRIPTGYQGIAFGIMDGVITALGVLTGLSVFGSRLIIFIGIMVTGMADAFANAAGMHASEEMEKLHEKPEIWKATIYTFFSTLVVFAILAMPMLFLQFSQGIVVSWLFGIFFLIWLGSFVGEKGKRLKMILEYVAGGIAISLIAYLLGSYAAIFLR